MSALAALSVRQLPRDLEHRPLFREAMRIAHRAAGARSYLWWLVLDEIHDALRDAHMQGQRDALVALAADLDAVDGTGLEAVRKLIDADLADLVMPEPPSRKVR